MSHAYASSELADLIQQQMASGRFESEEGLLVHALQALKVVEQQQDALRQQLQRRAEQAGKGLSHPIDAEEFKAEVRRKAGN